MPVPHDVILRGGHVIDPVNGLDGLHDIAIDGGMIAAVGHDLGPAREQVDATGLHVLPGIIDTHVHLSSWLGGAEGHRMLARAGVTTAFDVAGPVGSVMDLAARYGTGLTLACIDYVRPGHTVDTTDPAADELRDHLARARAQGAIGLKVLGGHFPLTAEATARVIAVCAENGAHVAFHAGTLDTPQDMRGLRQALDLAAGHPLHLPHVNAYVRGSQDHILTETMEACRLIEAHPNIWSESYLAPFNGNSAKCANGIPESVATQRNLVKGGYAATSQGMEDAILGGWAHVHMPQDGENLLATGEAALAAWRAADSDIGCSFYVNPPEARINLAIMKRASGRFAIDALATDGGGIPRNDLCERGLALVALNALTLGEFVVKTSAEPARMMGLPGKGHLGIGADGDITLVDLARRQAVSSFGGGRPILRDGVVVGRGATILSPPEAEQHLRDKGLQTRLTPPFQFRPLQPSL
ncbi:amidohydrolase family protein [Paracoccus shanxieyensis]|uniref:Amidohydrolase family protein n=1 Tax=Paracoccus shanxieyensis TaxID=2675752 RepID=A0A6L6J0W6_9RHOB|nr:amidohydrolase family protein [Paracoccus shanxieyensis]MTH66213.1 amidohydrolase family protein [Paracoccus shanxieyensis]MTH89439.1 amidohydrolase family protein [Paracoccus shanxieyensis]